MASSSSSDGYYDSTTGEWVPAYKPKPGEYGSDTYKYIPGVNQPMPTGGPASTTVPSSSVAPTTPPTNQAYPSYGPGGWGNGQLDPVTGAPLTTYIDWKRVQDRQDPRVNAANVTSETAPSGGTTPMDFLDFVRQKGYTGTYGRSNLPDIVTAYNKQTGSNYGVSGHPGDYDKIRLPNGQLVDVILGNANNDWWWNPIQEGGGGGGTAQSGGDRYQAIIDQLVQQLMGRMAQPSQPQPSPVNDQYLKMLQAEQTRRSTFEDSVRNSILGIMNQKQPTADEMLNTPEAKAYQRVQERAMNAARAQSAEQRSAQGVGQNQFGEVSGPLKSDISTGHEQLAERLSAMESQIVSRELGQRRQQLMQALQMGAGILNQDQETALRRELAQLDAQLRTQGMHQSTSLGLLQMLLGNQFGYDQLGYNLGGQEAAMNRNIFGGLG